MHSWPRMIVFVRHGESEGNVMSEEDRSTAEKANHRFVLTERGASQAVRVGQYLRFHPRYGEFDARYVSTYRRTHQTMHCMMQKPLGIREDARLDEWWKGVWYEMPREQVRAHYPFEVKVRERSGPYHYRPPGGESGADVECRIRSFLTDLRLNHAGERVLIAAHGRWLQFLHKIVNGLPSHKLDTVQKIPNCSLTVCVPDQQGHGLMFEHFAHLPDEISSVQPALWP